MTANFSWLFVDRLIRTLGALIASILVARYLGPADFGLLSYALAYVALFNMLIDLGMGQIVVREAVRDQQEIRKILGTVYVLKLTGGILAIALILVLLKVTYAEPLEAMVILLTAGTLLFQSFDNIDYFFQSKVKSRNVAISRSSAFLLALGVKIWLIQMVCPVEYFAMATLLEFMLVSAFLIISYQFSGYRILDWRFDRAWAGKLLEYSWPLAIAGFLSTIHTRIDQVMIGNLLDSAEVGVYSIAIRLSESWYFIPAVLASTLLPMFVKWRESNPEAYQRRLLWLYSLMFWMGAIAGVAVIFLGESLIEILFGAAYSGAYTAFVLVIWNGIFVSQAVVRGMWLISENLQRYRLYNSMMAVMLNILANLWLIPRYGITGAAIATLLTQGLGTWVFSMLWKPMRESTLAMIRAINPVYLLQRP